MPQKTGCAGSNKIMLMVRQTDKKRTNEWTELHQFQKEPRYDGDLSHRQV